MENTIALKDSLKRWPKEAQIEKETTLVSKSGNRLIICTRLPGWYIGKGVERRKNQ